MKRIRISVDVRDKVFARAFADKMSIWFDVVMSFDESCDVILSDCEGKGDLCIVLYEHEEDETHVFVFSGCEHIRRKIVHAYCLMHGDTAKVISSANTEVIGVCSCCGGTGNTEVSESVARVLKGDNLVVSLDDIPPVYENVKDAPIDVNRFIFELIDGKDISPQSVTYIDNTGVSHLRYHEPYNLLAVSEDGIFLKVIEGLSDETFDHIVVDMGCRTDEPARAVMSISRFVIFVDNGCNDKKDKYENIMFNDFEGSIKRIRNMVRDEQEDIFSDKARFIPFLEKNEQFTDYLDSHVKDLIGQKS